MQQKRIGQEIDKSKDYELRSISPTERSRITVKSTTSAASMFYSVNGGKSPNKITKYSKYYAEEDAKLLALMIIHEKVWPRVRICFPNRSESSLKRRASKFLKGKYQEILGYKSNNSSKYLDFLNNWEKLSLDSYSIAKIKSIQKEVRYKIEKSFKKSKTKPLDEDSVRMIESSKDSEEDLLVIIDNHFSNNPNAINKKNNIQVERPNKTKDVQQGIAENKTKIEGLKIAISYLEKSTDKLREELKIEEESFYQSEKILEKQRSKAKRQKVTEPTEKTADSLSVVEVKSQEWIDHTCKKKAPKSNIFASIFDHNDTESSKKQQSLKLRTNLKNLLYLNNLEK